MPDLTVLCFSKDRPLQLDGYLRSLKVMGKAASKVTALITCSDNEFESAYRELASAHDDIEFAREENFKQQVRNVVRRAETPAFMFGCDDVIFKRNWELADVLDLFDRLPTLIGFSLRLGSEITSFQSKQGKVGMAVPEFLQKSPFLVWKWPGRARDWGYPWEMCCTIYRTPFVRDMLRALDERPLIKPWRQRDWGHPNRLEAHGEDIIARFAGKELMASYPLARTNTLTVNRVQDVFDNQVLNNISTHELLRLWNRRAIMNLEYYADKSYDTIEIGDFQIMERFKK